VQQPIIFVQCGPILYMAAKPVKAPHDVVVDRDHKSRRWRDGAPRYLRALVGGETDCQQTLDPD
jgi:hypothetical protein